MIKKLFLLICIILFSVSALAAEETGAKGLRLFKEGLYEDALETFNRAWMKYPEQKNYETYIELCKKIIRAQNLFEETEYKESLLLTEEVSLLMPKDEKIRMLLAQRKRAVKLKESIEESYRLGDQRKVLEAYQDLLDLNPQDVRSAKAVDAYRQYGYQLDKARQLFRKGEWDNSLQIYSEAWTMLPADPWVQKAISMNIEAVAVQDLYKNGQYKEAAVGFKDLFSENPESNIFRVYMLKANKLSRLVIEMRVQFSEGKFDKAQEVAGQILAIEPEDIESKEMLTKIINIQEVLAEGDKYLLENNYKLAYQKYKVALAEAPEIPFIKERDMIIRTIVQQKQKRDPAFKKEELVKYDTYPKLKDYVFSFRSTQKQVKAEVAIVEKLIDLRTAGINLFYAGDYPEAIEKFDQALEINADDNAAIRFRYRAKTAQKYRKEIKGMYLADREQEAKEIYKKLILINPEEKSFRQLTQEYAD
ncbi:hypothetical protein ACFL5G_04530 [Candidatus Margulisiibacteriota bacterium]